MTGAGFGRGETAIATRSSCGWKSTDAGRRNVIEPYIVMNINISTDAQTH
jgi:hypothetical protein